MKEGKKEEGEQGAMRLMVTCEKELPHMRHIFTTHVFSKDR
jgi:hypothetical protein